MDLDVCVHPFPVLRSEEGAEGGTRLGCLALRGPPRRGCRWGFGAVRGLLLLLPTLLLLILGLGACLLLLHRVPTQGSTSTCSKTPGGLDLRRVRKRRVIHCHTLQIHQTEQGRQVGPQTGPLGPPESRTLGTIPLRCRPFAPANTRPDYTHSAVHPTCPAA